jgi:hypothetical protein
VIFIEKLLSMTIFHHKLLTTEGMVLANEMKLILNWLMGLKVHHDGFKLVKYSRVAEWGSHREREQERERERDVNLLV